ncbi:unnamed protein product [Symbiodinium sp. KB8]|nr:unnamed protein product [Symbiodinium sp. KB8]
MWSPGVDDQTAPTMTSAGIYQGWQFETVMQDPRVVLGTGTTRAGAVGGVLQIAFVPANAASKLILTAVSPSGWDFQAVDVCESVDEAVVCVRASASANSPNVLILDDISIKAQVLFQRELRNVRLASGGGIARFELATFALGQMGNEVAADSSGSLATWRLPGALEVSALQLGTYQSIVRDTGDTIFQQLPPRLLLRETVLIIHFSVTQACFSGDILSLEDPTGTFEMFQENATIKQVGNGFMICFHSPRTMEQLHRFAASLVDARSAQPLVENACASRANRDSWTYSVFCREVCVAESEDPDATFVPSIDWPLYVTLKEARAEDLLQANPNAVITSYSEWRSKFNEGQYLTLLFYHAFLLLEVEGGLGIWTEKYNDKLELMYGELETLRAFGQGHRATGELRKPSLQHSQVTLDACVTLQDLVDWICNCQHYARDLIQFLHDKRLAENLKSDREVVLSAVQSEGCRLQHATERLKDDRALVLAAVSSDGAALAFASKRLRCDKGLALAAVTKCGAALQFCTAFLHEDEDIVFAAVGQDATALRFASTEMKCNPCVITAAATDVSGVIDWSRIFTCSALTEDFDVAATAIGLDWRAGEWVSDGLRSDAHFMKRAVLLNGLVLQLVPENVRQHATVLRAVHQNGLALQFAGEELRADQRVVREAIAQNAMALQFASEVLRARRDVVLMAVVRNGHALQFASEDLQQDHTLVLTAARRFLFADWSWFFQDKAIKDQRHIAVAAVSMDASALPHTGRQADKEVVLAALQQDGQMLEFASEDLQADPSVVLVAVASDGTALRFASNALRGCRKVVSVAVRQNGLALQFAEHSLRCDSELLRLAARRWWSCDWSYLFAASNLQNDRDVVLEAVRIDWRALQSVGEKMQKDAEVVSAALAQNLGASRFISRSLLESRTEMLELLARRGAALQFAPEAFRADHELVQAAVAQDGSALQFASEELRRDSGLDRNLEAVHFNAGKNRGERRWGLEDPVFAISRKILTHRWWQDEGGWVRLAYLKAWTNFLATWHWQAGSDLLMALAPIVEVGDNSNKLSHQHEVSICNRMWWDKKVAAVCQPKRLLLDFPSSASAKPPNALEITVEDVMAPGTVFCLQLNARLRRQIEQTSTNEVSRKLFNFRAFRSTESLPLNTNDGLILTSLLSQESWSSSSLLLPFNMAAQVGAPGTQIQVSGDIQVVDDLWLLAPVGVVIVSPCSPTPCSDITQDFNGTGRQAALLLPTSERFGLRVELPASWDSGRNDWVAVVPAQGRLDGVKAKMWASDNSVSLRAMPASVTYPAVALTFSVDLAVSLSPGAAALALLGSASQSYIQVQAPVGYTLRCGGFRSSLPDSARVDCQVGPGPGEAVLGISNVDLNAAGTLHFSFGLDTPAADPSPNLFSIALRDASNVTLDAAMAVPGMHIPQARVEAFVSLLVVDFENVARLQAWGEAAQELGVLRGSIAAALNIGEEGVSVDYVQAVLGISDARRLQSSGVVAGQLQVNFSAYSNLVQLAELSDRIVVGGFAAGLQSELGPRAIAAGLVELQVTGASVPATPVPSQPPNVTTPTLRWSSADANSTGTVSVNLIFQRSTSAIRRYAASHVADQRFRLPAPSTDMGQHGLFSSTSDASDDTEHEITGARTYRVPVMPMSRRPACRWQRSRCKKYLFVAAFGLPFVAGCFTRIPATELRARPEKAVETAARPEGQRSSGKTKTSSPEAEEVDAWTYVFGKPGELRRDLSLVNTSPEKLLGAGLLAVVIGLASNLWGQTEFLFSVVPAAAEKARELRLDSIYAVDGLKAVLL